MPVTFRHLMIGAGGFEIFTALFLDPFGSKNIATAATATVTHIHISHMEAHIRI